MATVDTTAVDIVHPIAIERVPDLVHQVRGLRFFTRHLGGGIAAIGRSEGLVASFERSAAAPIFLVWVEQIAAQRAAAERDRRDYICFSAGMLLKHLVTTAGAIRALPAPGPAAGPASEIVRIWPEGYLATSYCMTVLDTVLDQERLAPTHMQPVVGRPDAWRSFRETVREDPWTAIAFLDLFIGNEPNWITPSIAAERPAIKAARGGQRRLAS